MIVKKLAVPLINDKVLQQAEHCYIATAGISEEAFDFIKNRLHPKCKIEMVTGLDSLTSPAVLKRIWKNYQDKITLNIYTRNTFNANVFIFDLPFRKTVAYVGSGTMTMEGLKDQEEIFYKISDAKEIESLMSWFTSYYQFSTPLNEKLIAEYEIIYPSLKQREIKSYEEKRHVTELTCGSFSWDAIKFRNQFFKREDYDVLDNRVSSSHTPELIKSRNAVISKLLDIDNKINDQLQGLNLFRTIDFDSTDPKFHVDGKIRSLWLSYGRSESELKKYSASAHASEFITIQFKIKQKEVGVWLVPGLEGKGEIDRMHFLHKMQDEVHRITFLKLLTALGDKYYITIAGSSKRADSFVKEDALLEFIKTDNWRYFDFTIGRDFTAGDPEIITEKINESLLACVKILQPLYMFMKDQTFAKLR